MVFNKNITGFDNEKEFCNALNNKKVFMLDPMFREFIFDLFDNVYEDDFIKCRLSYGRKKYDILISIKENTKYISIKKGVKNSVHVEGISDFVSFLIENNVDKENVINYLKYHYADGTTNGTGTNRKSADEYKKSHQVEIDEINIAINDEVILRKAIDRFVVKGNNSDKSIDAIIFGVVNDFIWIKKEDIIKIILSKKNIYSSAIHFGPLTVQPLDRSLNRNPKYEKCRFSVQVKWYNLVDDIIENMNSNVMQYSGYQEKI